MIGSIKKGDHFAYEQAFLQLRSRLYGFFLRKTNCPEDARDLVQITFLKLWQYRHTLDENFSIEQHLFRISRTVFIDYLRKQQTAVKWKNNSVNDKVCYIPEDFDLRKKLYTVLDAMPGIRKQVFELHRFQGLSYAEIASRLSITVKSVDNHISKAMRLIKKAVVLHLLLPFGFLSDFF
ncbi:RNA polymerase sigma factor [Chitinophaga filiformis]|uniref:RNA polymerase sigma-70 factor, ECF subfamily n=1 Tax=Chitinophaga filiformis TaxID=104663 RepID=A0A1G8ABI4_CHIFI|nr:sigma-70 family RNA polymerase sigma factor [Chitinophaga filiformis]SDH18251.1 RNA polymerase sigma-70 factor, ECF subfamily [Chitinophaga filiformis]